LLLSKIAKSPKSMERSRAFEYIREILSNDEHRLEKLQAHHRQLLSRVKALLDGNSIPENHPSRTELSNPKTIEGRGGSLIRALDDDAIQRIPDTDKQLSMIKEGKGAELSQIIRAREECDALVWDLNSSFSAIRKEIDKLPKGEPNGHSAPSAITGQGASEPATTLSRNPVTP
jgi:hypothetical protein